MHAEVTFQLATLYGFLLALARVSGVVAFVPIPGFSAGPDASRVVLSLALTTALFPAWSSGALSAGGGSTLTTGPLLGGIVSETFFGATIGLAVSFLLEGIQLAAQILGLQAGYSYASTVDPTTQADTTTLQLMAQLFGGTLFFAFGFDRQVIAALAASFDMGPNAGLARQGFGLGLGTGPGIESVVESIVRLGASVFTSGVELAMPVLALLILFDIAFAVLGRLHAQLQLLSLSFSLKMLAALVFLASVLAAYPAVFERSGAITFRVLDRVLSPGAAH
jgi:flagellar biosynthetic protein FliR